MDPAGSEIAKAILSKAILVLSELRPAGPSLNSDGKKGKAANLLLQAGEDSPIRARFFPGMNCQIEFDLAGGVSARRKLDNCSVFDIQLFYLPIKSGCAYIEITADIVCYRCFAGAHPVVCSDHVLDVPFFLVL